ncbi:MAG: ISNCY family transposase [Thermodesulfobacteriota bacterium]|nr:ISNCY family transposase [Thermodesulfobacteriota bacterium]
MEEIRRLKVLTLVENGNMTRAEAAKKLNLSERQLYRIQKSYREKGEQGLVHGNRGKPSHRRISEEVRAKIKTLLEDQYSDYNTLHFQEILAEAYGIEISYTTLQRIRRKAEHPTPKAKKSQKHRKRRPPRPIYGMMLQADASIHPWLEDRAPKLALVALIDDATNKVWGTFRAYEDAAGYVEVLQAVCLTEGIPMELYTDRRNVFQDQRELSIEDQLAGLERTSHFKAILDNLGIKLIQANSPQAKGRVERLFETLQDRLVKALREANAQTLEEANQVLQDYLPKHNKRFIKKAAQEGSALVPWPPEIAPDELFCFRHTRKVRNDNTISFDNVVLQIPPGIYREHYAKATVELRQHLDCALTVYYHGNQIARFEQANGFPLRIGTFVPVPEKPIELDFIPDLMPAEMSGK